MFKKFSSLLIIFAFAISLTGLSVTENAQGCGDDPSVKSVGGGDGSFETWVDIWAEDSHLESNLFVVTKTDVQQACLVCKDPETFEEQIVLSTAPVIIENFSPAEDLVDLEDGNYELPQTMCDTACGECDDGINQLTLQYNGPPLGAWINVYQDSIIYPVFFGFVEAGAEFSLNVIRNSVTPNKFYIGVNSQLNTIIDLSCSDNETTPRSGRVYGDFEVVTSFSRHSGLLCPLDATSDAGVCDGAAFEDLWGLTGEEPIETASAVPGEEPIETASEASGLDCGIEGLIPSEFHVQKVFITGSILMDCASDEYDEDGNPVDCNEVDKMCVYCWTYEECESWDDDGRVDYICAEIVCQSPVE